MVRKITSFLLLMLLGLYLPAASASMCLCLGPAGQVEAESCCVEVTSCCEDQETNANNCCGDPGCCVVIPALPDGMEPQLTLAPSPNSLPAPVILEDTLAAPPSRECLFPPLSHAAPAPPQGAASVRIAFGVWRL